MNNKSTETSRKNAAALYEALSASDDRYVEGALAYGAKKRKGRAARAVVLAAAITLILLAASAALLSRKPEANEKSPDDTTPAINDRLEAVLVSHSGDPSVADGREEIDFGDGRLKLVWKLQNDSGYRVAYLPESCLEKINRCLISGNSEGVAYRESGEGTLDGVWLVFGNGSVVSPYLKMSDGNIAFLSLFGYSPELEPDAALAELIAGILEAQAR